MKEIDREKIRPSIRSSFFYCRYNTIHYDQEYNFNQTAHQSINRLMSMMNVESKRVIYLRGWHLTY